ncbi:MAG: response regulator transcription factor [SAR202 cluster bacterium]|nr:response regulator transcription factor [SAR202 cluster bacterium]
MAEPKVLIVDDEADFQALVQSWLEDDGYEVYTAANGWEGLQIFADVRPALTITDVRMPAMDGFQLISRIREISDAHILALTAMGDTENTVRGLEIGADEYLVKPVAKREFLARVRSLVRRAKPPGEVPVRYQDTVVMLDLLTHDASCRGESIHMRPTEYRLLTYLTLNKDRVLSHQELLDNVWGDQGGSLDSLKWHISALREKIESDPKKPSIIVTFPRVGYRYILP